MAKNLFILTLMISLFFTGCSGRFGNDRSPITDSAKNAVIKTISGGWVLASYLDDLDKTKSPLRSSSLLTNIVSMAIKGHLNNDSMPVDISWNNHEGTNGVIYFDSSLNENQLKISVRDDNGNDTISHFLFSIQKTETDTLVFIDQYDKENHLLKRKMFTRILKSDVSNDVGYILQYAVNKELFAGDYILTDNSQTKVKVKFSNDGTLVDFPGCNSYVVQTDFMGGPLNNLDQLCFNLNEKMPQCYTFVSKKDRIEIFETSEDKEHIQLYRGKLKYTLFRQYHE